MNTTRGGFAALRNGASLPWREVPALPLANLQDAVAAAIDDELRLAALFALQRAGEREKRLVAVLADDADGRLLMAAAPLPGPTFPALTTRSAQAHLFEREIHEQFGLLPAGHPWCKPVRFERRLGDASAAAPPIGATDFYRIAGDAIHEVAVGPVHAGVIEPGHFRFQCHGEHVFHLEISLGYQHRGVETALLAGPHRTSLAQIETLAGDTTVGHALAYCQNLEALAALRVSGHDHVVRAIALELERLANHTGDLGALASDVGYLPTASFCGRLRGDFLNLSALLCGSRFGRGLVRPGGARFPLDAGRIGSLRERLADARRDVTQAVGLLWVTPSVVARFEDTGTVSAATGTLLGLVGPAARASGIEIDVRAHYPTGAYCFVQQPIATAHTGDVHARAFVRGLEIQRSMNLIDDLLSMLPPPGAPPQPVTGALRGDHVAVTLVEGWRGELCHVASTGPDGRFDRYKIVDPSFHNWAGLAMALRDQQISDFPLCNKSFNLSYCGHDL
ncbi:MAG: hydrogenase [Planctomycetota bacterium]